MSTPWRSAPPARLLAAVPFPDHRALLDRLPAGRRAPARQAAVEVRTWVTPRGKTELDFPANDSMEDFVRIAAVLLLRGAELVERADGLDQSYWDFRWRGAVFTLHHEHFAGNALWQEGGEPTPLLDELRRELEPVDLS